MEIPDRAATADGLFAVTVGRRSEVAECIISLELLPETGCELPPFSAGAHIDVELPNGMVRQYSLLGDARRALHYEIGILRDPASRGGSACAHADLREGDRLRISRPRNLFPLVAARRSLLLAGGIGITPLLAMARQLAHDGADFALHYCGRSLARMAFIDRLGEAPFAGCVHLHPDDGAPDTKLDAAALLAAPAPDTHLYVCGPGGFMDHVIDTARSCGWNDGNIHFECFAATVPAREGDRAFEMVLARSGRVIPVAPDETALAALCAYGVDVPVSCEQGICGTCATRVLDGEPDHRDMYFSDAEKAANDSFTPCCSRARSARLVLDL
jgi:vanillate monooxygenase ferredoxin subunit